jgi:hypothetical protein
MTDTAVDPAAIASDAVALAELDGGTGRERVRIDWLLRRLHDAPGSRRVDDAGNLVWAFGPPPYRLAVLAGSIATGASQPRAVLQEVLELTPRAARN